MNEYIYTLYALYYCPNTTGMTHFKIPHTQNCPTLFVNKYYSEILQILAQLLENKAQSVSLQEFEPCSSQMQVRRYRTSAKFLPTTPHFICTDRA